MKIYWFTIAAQALNFIVLVWLLRRFLYKPILNVIDEREKRIATRLDNAEKQQADAQKEHSEFKQKNEAFDQQRAALFSKATDEVHTHRQELLDEARSAAETLRSQQLESLRNGTKSLHQEISRQAQLEIFAIARKTLMDLAEVDLEEQVAAVFVHRLSQMDSQAKAEITAMKNASESLLVRSAFDLPSRQRAAIQNTLNETFAAPLNLRFETAPDLIAGIELNANGYKVTWSITDYLSSMEQSIDTILDKKDISTTHAENLHLEPATEGTK
jgi:F-type H+-transporting ATPase subunit b